MKSLSMSSANEGAKAAMRVKRLVCWPQNQPSISPTSFDPGAFSAMRASSSAFRRASRSALTNRSTIALPSASTAAMTSSNASSTSKRCSARVRVSASVMGPP